MRVLLHSLVCKEESTDMRKSILPVGGKFMEHITLFTDILPEEQERMRVCFKVREKVFQNGETIMEYSSSMKKNRSDPGGKSSSLLLRRGWK